MIHLFDNSRRTLLFPVNWANSVVRWIQGVHSPSGTITVRNELNPGDGGSVELDVNIGVVAAKIAAAMSDIILTRDDVVEIITGSVDGCSIISEDGRLMISEDWIKEAVARYAETPEDLTHDDITDWDSATADFLDSDDYDALEGAIEGVSDIVDGILADYLTSGDVGISVAAQSHTHSGYAAVDHTHSGYAAANHSHSEYALTGHSHSGYAAANHTHSGYAASSHTHAKADLTNFDTNVKANIPVCYQAAPVEYTGVASQYVMFYIPGSGGGSVCWGDLDDEYAQKNHTHTGYADVNHTHDGYAAANHTHSGYAAANHDHAGVYANAQHQHVSADITDLGSTIDGKITTYSNTAASTYATITTVNGLSQTVNSIDADLSDLVDYVADIDDDLNVVETWKATGKGSTFNIVTGVEWTGTVLRMTRKSVTFTNGLITEVRNDSTVTIDTPVLFDQS